MGTAGGTLAERAARWTRAQGRWGGGVIHMGKGTVLFDGVAISGTEAQVRTGGWRCVPGPMRVGGAGRGRFRMEATPGAARLCAGRRRRGLDERRGSHVQGRQDHQHQGDGAHLARSVVGMLVLDAARLRIVRGVVCGARSMGMRDSMIRSSDAVSIA